MPKLNLTLLVNSCLALGLASSLQIAKSTEPLPQAHAHNDYLHEPPLIDALEHGFCSVEADIFLVNGELRVAHTSFELRGAETLETLYLAPLERRVKENGGRVFKNGPKFTLLIDIKSKAEPTYEVLHNQLAKFQSMLERVENGKPVEGAIQVIVSGNRPFEYMAKQEIRYAGLDGRLTDLKAASKPNHLMPLISDRWTSHFSWRGKGDMPQAERELLHQLVQQTHARKQRIRFWATPDVERIWQELARAEVDLINTDDLAGLEAFLTR